MTDEPATTPTCGKCGSDLPRRGCCPCIEPAPAADRCTNKASPSGMRCSFDADHDGHHGSDHIQWALGYYPPTPAADPRVTALMRRCGQLREQRDEARREVKQCRAGRELEQHGLRNAITAIADLTAERDEARDNHNEHCGLGAALNLQRERDEARAQAVAATTDADDLRAVARDVVMDYVARCCDNPATCACSMARMARAIGGGEMDKPFEELTEAELAGLEAREWTSEEITWAINAALVDRNMEAVVALLHRLARVDPREARAIILEFIHYTSAGEL